MADQRTSNDLSPQLCAVLSSLNVSLEAELNRYRRNRVVRGKPDADLFADLEDASFNLDGVELLMSPPVGPSASLPAGSSAIVTSAAPPPVPRNKKLPPAGPNDAVNATVETVSASVDASLAGALARTSADATHQLADGADLAGLTDNRPDNRSNDRSEGSLDRAISAGYQDDYSSHYLDSSEKLIESLAEMPPLPAPVESPFKPRRKTVSLLAGAILGLLGLVAGLGASYLMSNPTVAQRLASGLKGEKVAIAPLPEKTFDPPGPDLSAREFVDIKLDNLSSLKMPQTVIDPLAAPSTATTLPPIAGQLPTATQAVAIPAGSNYYVTVPFTTEQNLLEVRKSVEEAFVRQFADGNRVQLAAFDSVESAQQFIDEIKATGITAQLYGPTNE